MAKAKGKSTTLKTVTELYGEFARANALARAVPSEDEKKLDAAVGKVSDLAMALVKTPSASTAEMLLKIRVAGWGIGFKYEQLEDLDNWRPNNLARSEEHYALASLREDIRVLLANR
jgi:hypothetical protein